MRLCIECRLNEPTPESYLCAGCARLASGASSEPDWWLEAQKNPRPFTEELHDAAGY